MLNKFAIILIAILSIPTTILGFEFHTTPDKWKEARNVYGDFERGYINKIKISRTKINIQGIEEKSKIYSPNNVYWFFIDMPDTSKPSPWSTQIRVFNEKDYLISIMISDLATQYETKAQWINDKLIYIQFWWGRVAGSYLIFDAEKEKILVKEMFYDGEIILQQWKNRDN